MRNKGLLIFVEGPDDDRFVQAIFIAFLKNQYSWIQTYTYATKPPKVVTRYIQSLISMNADYMFVTDLDEYPCISNKKESIKEHYPQLDNSKIMVVKREIECWYLAGIDDVEAHALGLERIKQTDEITKEIFNQWMPRHFISRIEFMQEILSHYSIPTAITKNLSFQYVVKKLGIDKG